MAITSEEAIASLQKRGLTPTQARIKAEFERLSGNQTNAISPTQPPLAGINSLEDIQKKIQAISGQIPTIQAGVQTLQRQPKPSPAVQLQPQATEPTEGSTRINPQTGQKERFSPAGVWEAMPTAEQIGQFAPPPGTEGVAGAGTGAQPQAPTSDVVKSPLDALSLQSGASLSKLDLDGFAKIIRDAYQPVADAQKAYLDELKATPSLVKQFEELLTAQGIPQLRKEFSIATKRALEVEAQLERLPDDVKQRVQDYLITQKQFERVTATEAKPLTALYNAITRSRAQTGAELESRMAEINTYISLIDKDTQRKMNALQFGIQTSQGQFDITSKVAEMGLGEQQRQLQTEKIQAEIEKLKRPEVGTQFQQEQSQIPQIQNRLLVSKGTDGFVDPAVYTSERSKSVLSPSEFDSRFSNLLSPQEKRNLEIKTSEPQTVAEIESQTRNIISQYKNAGYSRKNIEKQWKADNNTSTLSPLVKKILDELF